MKVEALRTRLALLIILSIVIPLANPAVAENLNTRGLKIKASSVLFKGKIPKQAENGNDCLPEQRLPIDIALRIISSGAKYIILIDGSPSMKGTYSNGTLKGSSTQEFEDGQTIQTVVTLKNLNLRTTQLTYRQISTDSNGTCDLTYKGNVVRKN